ncbi:MAG TPA: hypothetical protein VMT18_09150 [Planctomycetota bacterium]|nr:hypothetical protein [Planctomycetota bacterium]
MLRPEHQSALFLRPAVALVLAWAAVVVARLLFAAPTALLPAPGETLRFLATWEYFAGSAVQALLAIALWIDLRWARQAPRGLRRAQVVAQFAALVLLALIQVLGTLAYIGLTR